MARDGAFPGSERLRVVWPYTKSPLMTVLLVFVIDVIMLLLPLGTSLALSAVLECVVQWSIATKLVGSTLHVSPAETSTRSYPPFDLAERGNS